MVVPAAAEPARPGTAGKSRATQKPGATSDAEWRTAFCKTQDLVFELQFATRYAAGIARSMDIEAFRRTLRIVRTRAAQARRDRQWASMVRLNHRLQEGEHRLICR